MKKTYTLSFTLDELDYQRALTVLAESGLTPENLAALVLERTAREGALPLRKSRARVKKPAAAMPGLFEQGSLFDDAPAHEEELPADVEAPPAEPTALLPTLVTIASLQDAQAMLRWRARERAAQGSSALLNPDGTALALIETKQFRFDKSAIVASAHRAEIISVLDALFTELTAGRTPPAVKPLDDGKSAYIALSVPGLPADALALIYEASESDICLVRYGSPDALVRNPPKVR